MTDSIPFWRQMVAPSATLRPSPRFFSGALLPSPPHSLRRKRSSIAIPRAHRAAAPPPSPLPSLRPPNRRPNHLRRKLLRTLTPPPLHPVPEPPQAPLEQGGGGWEASDALVEEGDPRELQLPLLPLSHENTTDGYALVVEEKELSLLLRHEVRDQGPLFPKAHDQRDIPRMLLELSVYLVGLLAVQTLCAVCLFGGVVSEEGKSDGTAANAMVGEVKGAEPEVRDGEVEFERTVVAIQAMAREARAAEARNALEKGGVSGLRGDIMDEVNRRLGRLAKKTPRVYLDMKALSNALAKGNANKARRTPAKGFNSSKGSAASTRNLSNGTTFLVYCKIPVLLVSCLKLFQFMHSATQSSCT